MNKPILSPAKLNLSLQITGIKANNYHELNSYFTKLNFGDFLSFSNKTSGINIKVIGKYKAPNNHENLIWQAVKLLQQYSHTNFGINITLDKNIPLGSGLGGGSSNAGTALVYLNEYWQLKLTTKELLALAVKLGADVPFFVSQYNLAKIEGIGEIINPISLQDQNLSSKLHINFTSSQIVDEYQILLIIPHYININTAWAYKLIDNYYAKQFLLSCNNVFSEPIFNIYPDLQFIKNTLVDYGAILADLTGSGSVVFGIFSDEKDLTKVKNNLAGKGNIIECRLL